MAQEQASNGQNSDQSASAGEGSDAGGEETSQSGGGGEDRFAKLEARFELLNGSLSDLRQAILEGRRTQAPAPAEVDDDDEPLSPSKVRKIVQSAVVNASVANQGLMERREWDAKAKSEFPLQDPKFLVEFKKEWSEQTSAGLDPNHPKAIYNVAKITARNLGVRKPAPKGDAETAHSSEAPTQSPASRPPVQRSSTAKISDDDPRLRFYKMKGNRSKDQIEQMKQRLAEKDSSRRQAR